MVNQPQQERRGPGRPPKSGPRVDVHYQLPPVLVEILKQDAAMQQVSAGDRLAEILAIHYSRKEAMPQAI